MKDSEEVSLSDKHKKERFSEDDENIASALKDEIEKLQNDVTQNLEGWKRAQADFQNFKKRVENERGETSAFFRAEVIKTFLPAIENFELALENVPVEVAKSQWFSGFKMLQASFEKALKENSVESYGQVGEEFDPNVHQALAQSEGPAGQITQVLSKGYKMGERILREVSVIVGQG